MNERDDPPVFLLALNELFRFGHIVRSNQMHRVLLLVGLLSELNHAVHEHPVPQPGVRHHVPGQRLRDQVSVDLAECREPSGRSHRGISPKMSS